MAIKKFVTWCEDNNYDISLDEKKLTTAERKKIPKSDFALPGKRAYPVEDKSHARNALARAAQHASPSEEAKIKAKVHKKFPDIGKDKKEDDE